MRPAAWLPARHSPANRAGPVGRPDAAALLLLLLLATLATALTSAPGALAAPARVGATFPPAALLQPGEVRILDGNLTYSYDEAGGNATALTITPVPGPAWLTVRAEPATATLAADRADKRTMVPVRLTLTVAPGTAALEQHTAQLRLEAGPNPPLNATAGIASVPVRVGFQGALRVEPTQERYVGPVGEPLTVGLRVVNEGNGPARVNLEAGGNATAIAAVAPGPLLVETRGQLRDRVVNVSVLPGVAGTHRLVLVYSSTHAFDHSLLGEAGEVVVTLEITGAGLLPAPDPLAPLVLAALAIAVLRRHRQRLT